MGLLRFVAGLGEASKTLRAVGPEAAASTGCLLAFFSLAGCGTAVTVGPTDASGAQSHDAHSHPVTFVSCQTDQDCPRFDHYCQSCPDGGSSCASSQCIDGGCEDRAAFCPTYACLGSCGVKCTQCNPADGGCRAGRCDYFSRCVTGDPYCATADSGRASCARTDAVAIGDCNAILGWGWDGSKCIPLVGCACQGIDCGNLIGSEVRCGLAFSYCPGDGGLGE